MDETTQQQQDKEADPNYDVNLLEERLVKIDTEVKEIHIDDSDVGPGSSEKNIEFKRDPSFQLLKIEEEKDNERILRIKLIDRLYFQPEGPFEMLIEHIGIFKVKGDIPEKFSEEDITNIGFALSMYSLSLASDITKKFGIIPLIVAPWRGLEEE